MLKFCFGKIAEKRSRFSKSSKEAETGKMFSRTPVLTENREENLENAKFEVKVGKGAGKMVNLRSLRRLTYFTV